MTENQKSEAFKMNNKETIEFILKYKDSIYHINSVGLLHPIDANSFIKTLNESSFFTSEIFMSEINNNTYFRIFDTSVDFSDNPSRTISNVYYINTDKKNLIDRKSKIQSIIK